MIKEKSPSEMFLKKKGFRSTAPQLVFFPFPKAPQKPYNSSKHISQLT